MTPDPFDELDDIVLDDDFIAGGAKEAAADERIAKAQRVARANNRLRAEGEISDGTGKPRFHRVRRSIPWIVIGAIAAAGIVVIAVLAR